MFIYVSLALTYILWLLITLNKLRNALCTALPNAHYLRFHILGIFLTRHLLKYYNEFFQRKSVVYFYWIKTNYLANDQFQFNLFFIYLSSSFPRVLLNNFEIAQKLHLLAFSLINVILRHSFVLPDRIVSENMF